jgi:hypothetical protein
MLIRKLSTVAAALSLCAVAAPVAGASAATTPAASGSQTPPSPLLTFVPPKVGSICAIIGPTIIGGKVMNAGLHVCTTGTTLPTFTWHLPY